MRKGMWLAAAFVVALSGTGALAADNNTVTMKDLYFEPADITVAVNTPVVFHNGSDSSPHDAKAEDNSFSTPMLGPGKEQTVTLSKVGDVTYYCTVPGHKSAGMVGTIHVTAAGGSTASTAATTATTQPGTATTATTPAGQTTTTTAKAASGGASSTTTTTAGTGVTATTQAPSVTPTSAPDAAAGGSSATGAAGQAGGEEAADHSSGGGAHKKKEKSSPIGIAFAAVSTVLLTGIAGKLLASKP